jgi:phosphatidylserine decarboxylase
VWKAFTDLDLSDAKKTRFHSLHDCFTRELREGARPIDPDPACLTSPCDAIVGACGRIDGDGQVFQAKGFPYALRELIGDSVRARDAIEALCGGSYVTLRLTSAMYHRFHAPDALTLEHVTHFSGDTWNVNPIALARVEKLFCRNERAALYTRLDDGAPLLLVPVAAILVASLRLRALRLPLNTRYRGPDELPCSARYARGEEMGHFEHGSTILVFAPPGVALAPGVHAGQSLRMGQPLLQRDARARHAAVM